ncbi:hypothetical protein [Streptomyces phaeochromogenes]
MAVGTPWARAQVTTGLPLTVCRSPPGACADTAAAGSRGEALLVALLVAHGALGPTYGLMRPRG